MFVSLSNFAPANFEKSLKECKTASKLEGRIKEFYALHDIALKSYLALCQHLKKMNSCGVSCETTVDFDDFDTNENDSEEEDVEEKKKSDEASNSDGKAYYQDALNILADERYHLIDAYPLLHKVYSIAVAIPISSCTAERSFSVLKRVKSRSRTTMIQDRLESLLMSIEKNILSKLDIDVIIDELGKSSLELAKLLLV